MLHAICRADPSNVYVPVAVPNAEDWLTVPSEPKTNVMGMRKTGMVPDQVPTRLGLLSLRVHAARTSRISTATLAIFDLITPFIPLDNGIRKQFNGRRRGRGGPIFCLTNHEGHASSPAGVDAPFLTARQLAYVMVFVYQKVYNSSMGQNVPRGTL